MNAADRARFATYCGMTCLGGSEKRQCPCKRPTECQLRAHPYYPVARDEAKARMLRFIQTIVDRFDERMNELKKEN